MIYTWRWKKPASMKLDPAINLHWVRCFSSQDWLPETKRWANSNAGPKHFQFPTSLAREPGAIVREAGDKSPGIPCTMLERGSPRCWNLHVVKSLWSKHIRMLKNWRLHHPMDSTGNQQCYHDCSHHWLLEDEIPLRNSDHGHHIPWVRFPIES